MIDSEDSTPESRNNILATSQLHSTLKHFNRGLYEAINVHFIPALSTLLEHYSTVAINSLMFTVLDVDLKTRVSSSMFENNELTPLGIYVQHVLKQNGSGNKWQNNDINQSIIFEAYSFVKKKVTDTSSIMNARPARSQRAKPQGDVGVCMFPETDYVPWFNPVTNATITEVVARECAILTDNEQNQIHSMSLESMTANADDVRKVIEYSLVSEIASFYADEVLHERTTDGENKISAFNFKLSAEVISQLVLKVLINSINGNSVTQGSTVNSTLLKMLLDYPLSFLPILLVELKEDISASVLEAMIGRDSHRTANDTPLAVDGSHLGNENTKHVLSSTPSLSRHVSQSTEAILDPVVLQQIHKYLCYFEKMFIKGFDSVNSSKTKQHQQFSRSRSTKDIELSSADNNYLFELMNPTGFSYYIPLYGQVSDTPLYEQSEIIPLNVKKPYFPFSLQPLNQTCSEEKLPNASNKGKGNTFFKWNGSEITKGQVSTSSPSAAFSTYNSGWVKVELEVSILSPLGSSRSGNLGPSTRTSPHQGNIHDLHQQRKNYRDDIQMQAAGSIRPQDVLLLMGHDTSFSTSSPCSANTNTRAKNNDESFLQTPLLVSFGLGIVEGVKSNRKCNPGQFKRTHQISDVQQPSGITLTIYVSKRTAQDVLGINSSMDNKKINVFHHCIFLCLYSSESGGGGASKHFVAGKSLASKLSSTYQMIAVVFGTPVDPHSSRLILEKKCNSNFSLQSIKGRTNHEDQSGKTSNRNESSSEKRRTQRPQSPPVVQEVLQDLNTNQAEVVKNMLRLIATPNVMTKSITNSNNSQLSITSLLLKSNNHHSEENPSNYDEISNSTLSVWGPPGTGKTSTIVNGIKQMLLLSPEAASGIVISNNGDGNRILICAPTNMAVDEVLLRLHRQQKSFWGRRRVPRLVRVGVREGIDSMVLCCGLYLDDIAEKKMCDLKPMFAQKKISEQSPLWFQELANIKKEILLNSDVVGVTLGSFTTMRRVLSEGSIKGDIKLSAYQRQHFGKRLTRTTCLELFKGTHLLRMILPKTVNNMINLEEASSTVGKKISELHQNCLSLMGDEKDFMPTKGKTRALHSSSYFYYSLVNRLREICMREIFAVAPPATQGLLNHSPSATSQRDDSDDLSDLPTDNDDFEGIFRRTYMSMLGKTFYLTSVLPALEAVDQCLARDSFIEIGTSRNDQHWIKEERDQISARIARAVQGVVKLTIWQNKVYKLKKFKIMNQPIARQQQSLFLYKIVYHTEDTLKGNSKNVYLPDEDIVQNFFSLVVIDECTQALEPLALLPIVPSQSSFSLNADCRKERNCITTKTEHLIGSVFALPIPGNEYNSFIYIPKRDGNCGDSCQYKFARFPGCSKLILVGDPNQLPPLMRSMSTPRFFNALIGKVDFHHCPLETAAGPCFSTLCVTPEEGSDSDVNNSNLLARRLMWGCFSVILKVGRIQNGNIVPKRYLSTSFSDSDMSALYLQYRMHSSIMRYCNNDFYENKLVTGRYAFDVPFEKIRTLPSTVDLFCRNYFGTAVNTNYHLTNTIQKGLMSVLDGVLSSFYSLKIMENKCIELNDRKIKNLVASASIEAVVRDVISTKCSISRDLYARGVEVIMDAVNRSIVPFIDEFVMTLLQKIKNNADIHSSNFHQGAVLWLQRFLFLDITDSTMSLLGVSKGRDTAKQGKSFSNHNEARAVVFLMIMMCDFFFAQFKILVTRSLSGNVNEGPESFLTSACRTLHVVLSVYWDQNGKAVTNAAVGDRIFLPAPAEVFPDLFNSVMTRLSKKDSENLSVILKNAFTSTYLNLFHFNFYVPAIRALCFQRSSFLSFIDKIQEPADFFEHCSIITFYTGQVAAIRSELNRKYAFDNLKKNDYNVDTPSTTKLMSLSEFMCERYSDAKWQTFQRAREEWVRVAVTNSILNFYLTSSVEKVKESLVNKCEPLMVSSGEPTPTWQFHYNLVKAMEYGIWSCIIPKTLEYVISCYRTNCIKVRFGALPSSSLCVRSIRIISLISPEYFYKMSYECALSDFKLHGEISLRESNTQQTILQLLSEKGVDTHQNYLDVNLLLPIKNYKGYVAEGTLASPLGEMSNSETREMLQPIPEMYALQPLVTVNTVDGFQGKENSIIFVNSVRSGGAPFFIKKPSTRGLQGTEENSLQQQKTTQAQQVSVLSPSSRSNTDEGLFGDDLNESADEIDSVYEVRSEDSDCFAIENDNESKTSPSNNRTSSLLMASTVNKQNHEEAAFCSTGSEVCYSPAKVFPRKLQNNLGFLANRNRTNVALSRAKQYCFVVGHSETLLNGDAIDGSTLGSGAWSRLVQLCFQGSQGQLTELFETKSGAEVKLNEELSSTRIGFCSMSSGTLRQHLTDKFNIKLANEKTQAYYVAPYFDDKLGPPSSGVEGLNPPLPRSRGRQREKHNFPVQSEFRYCPPSVSRGKGNTNSRMDNVSDDNGFKRQRSENKFMHRGMGQEGEGYSTNDSGQSYEKQHLPCPRKRF